MKKLATIFQAFLILTFSALAQTPTKTKRVPQNVSLDTILSCADDPYIQRVFKTNLDTMRKLGLGSLYLAKDRGDLESESLRGLGFAAISSVVPLEFGVIPYPSVDPAPFCSILEQVRYLHDVGGSFPYDLAIIMYPNYWVFNPNELFAHADQFIFRSGVFSNSSKVLCLAKTSYTCRMNDLAQSSIRIFPLQFLP